MEVREEVHMEVVETLYTFSKAGSRLIFRLSLAQKEYFTVTRLG